MARINWTWGLGVIALCAIPAAAQDRPSTRIADIDRNRDGVVSRDEWRGTEREFELRDWNRDGVLSGDELRDGARNAPAAVQNGAEYDDWTANGFARLDRNETAASRSTSGPATGRRSTAPITIATASSAAPNSSTKTAGRLIAGSTAATGRSRRARRIGFRASTPTATVKSHATSGADRAAASTSAIAIETAGSHRTSSARRRHRARLRRTRPVTSVGSPKAARLAAKTARGTPGISRGSASWNPPTPATTPSSARGPITRPVTGRHSVRHIEKGSTSAESRRGMPPCNNVRADADRRRRTSCCGPKRDTRVPSRGTPHKAPRESAVFAWT
jgi:hypothetical protein